MKMLAALSLLIFAACAHGGGPASGLRWEPLYGTYRFEGTLEMTPGARFGGGPQATPAARRVSGTLRLADGRYDLTSTDGSCDGVLQPLSGVDVAFGCRDGASISLRVMGEMLAGEGTATYFEPTFNEYEVCRTDADGNQVCTTRIERARSVYRGRVTLTRVPGEG